MSTRNRMPGRRSISLEPDELSSTSSPRRRSTRIKAIHVDSPAPRRDADQPEPVAARRTRRAQSIQEKSLNNIENDLEKRDVSPLSLKDKLFEDKPARKVKRSSSLQSEISEDFDSKPVRRTRRSIIAAKDIPPLVEEEKENEEEVDKTPELRGRPKRRVTRSMSKSPVDTKITKPVPAPVSRKYKLSLNKELQDSGKSSTLDIIDENEDELDKTVKSPWPGTKNIADKIATVVLEKLDTSTIEDEKNKTEEEDQNVPKSSDEAKINGEKKIKEIIIEIKQEESENELEVVDASQEEIIVVDVPVKSEDEEISVDEDKTNKSVSSEELHLFLEENEDNVKSPELYEKTKKEGGDSEEKKDQHPETKEKEVINNLEKSYEKITETIKTNPEITTSKRITEINKTVNNIEDLITTKELSVTEDKNESIKSNNDTNISLVCEKGTIENINDIEEDGTNISIVGSKDSSPKTISSTPTKENEESPKKIELVQNLSIVNDDGKSYSPIIGIVENINVDLEEDSIVDTSCSKENKSLHERSLRSSTKVPESPTLNSSNESVKKSTPSPTRKSNKFEIELIDEDSLETPASPILSKSSRSISNIEESTKISRSLLDVSKKSDEDTPREKSKKFNENEEFLLHKEIFESPELVVNNKSTKTPERISKRFTEEEGEHNVTSEAESSKLSVETLESTKQDVSTKSTEKTPKRKSKRFAEDNQENVELSEAESSKLVIGTPESTKLDVSKKSTEKTPKRKSRRFTEDNEEIVELSTAESSKLAVETPESIKLDVSKKSTEKTPKRKSKRFAEDNQENVELSEAESSKLVIGTPESTKLDVSKKSTEKTPKRKSRRFTEDNEEIVELSTAESSKLAVETPESIKLDVSKKSTEKTPKRKSKRFAEDNQENVELSEAESSKLVIGTPESTKLDVSKKSTEKTPKRKSRRFTEDNEEIVELSTAESSKLAVETPESIKLDVSKKSTEKNPKRKSKRFTEEEEKNEVFSEAESLKVAADIPESPKLDICNKSVDNKSKKKTNREDNEEYSEASESSKSDVETFVSPKLDANKKSFEKVPRRKSNRFTEEEEATKELLEAKSSKLEVETLESPKIVVSKKSTEKTPKRKSKKFTEEEHEINEMSVETLEFSNLNIIKNLEEKTVETKSSEFYIRENDSPKIKSLSLRKSTEEEELIQEEIIKSTKDSANKIVSPKKSPDSVQKNVADKKMDKLLDDYLLTYAEKKRKRDLDESLSTIPIPEEKKKRRSRVPEISFSDDESYDSDNENRHEFLDDMAFEGSEDTPSIDSNEIIDEGESIDSISTERDTDSDYEVDSFVVDDDVGNELLSGDDDDHIDNIPEERKRRRIITISDSSDEDLDNMSMKPFGGMSPPPSFNQIISVDSDLEMVSNKNKELSKQIENGIRGPEEDESVTILDESVDANTTVVNDIENTEVILPLEKDKPEIEDEETIPEKEISRKLSEPKDQEAETTESSFTKSNTEKEDKTEPKISDSKNTPKLEIIRIEVQEDDSLKKQILQGIERELVDIDGAEEIEKVPENIEKVEDIHDPEREIILNQDSSTIEGNDEKYQEILNTYFKQFDEDSPKIRKRRETLDVTTLNEENKPSKRERRTSLGSQNIVEESKQRCDSYCKKIKEKQEIKRKLSESKENIAQEENKDLIESPQKRKCLSKFNENKQKIIIEPKSKRRKLKSLNVTGDLVQEVFLNEESSENKKEVVKSRKSKRDSSLSYEINTSGVIVVSPRKIEDVTSKSNKRKSQVIDEASEMLKNVSNILNEEIEDTKIEKQGQENIEPDTVIIEKKITKVSKKKQKKNKKLDTSVQQFEDLAEVNIFKTPVSDKIISIEKKQNKKIKLDTSVNLEEVNLSPIKKQKKLKKTEQVEDLTEVNIFKAPVVAKVKSSIKEEKSSKRKKILTESVEKQKSSVEEIKGKQKRRNEKVEKKVFEEETLKTGKIKKIKNKNTAVRLENNFSAVSKFKVKKEKLQASKSEYLFSSKYDTNKSNKYKNLIKPSNSGWTDATVTVKNLCQSSHGIKKKKQFKHLKASLFGNINKFNVEDLFSEDLVKIKKNK